MHACVSLCEAHDVQTPHMHMPKKGNRDGIVSRPLRAHEDAYSARISVFCPCFFFMSVCFWVETCIHGKWHLTYPVEHPFQRRVLCTACFDVSFFLVAPSRGVSDVRARCLPTH